MRVSLLLLVVALGFGFSQFSAGDSSMTAQQPVELAAPKPVSGEQPHWRQLSSASCSASACHGGGKINEKGSEHSTWAPEAFLKTHSDPHAKAYRVLFNEQSVAIAKALNRAAAHTDTLCLKCHAVEDVQPAQAVVEGVGCGACHGPAEKWASEHTLPDWKSRPNSEKKKLGYNPLANLVDRTETCARCHVGDASREVNHDLIAAGHPRLSFESVAFHHNPDYRHHWHETSSPEDFAARAWICGQAASLRAATELLAERAERAAAHSEGAVWPEFSGYSCFSCHQKVGLDKLQRVSGAAPRPAGAPAWELWSRTAAKTAAAASSRIYPHVRAPELSELKKLSEEIERSNPNPKRVASQARKAVRELDQWIEELRAAEDAGASLHVSPRVAEDIARELAGNALTNNQAKLADHDWDALASTYLGCTAMYRAAGGKSFVPVWTKPLSDVGAVLMFQPGFNSPSTFGVDERIQIRDKLQEFLKLTQAPGERP